MMNLPLKIQKVMESRKTFSGAVLLRNGYRTIYQNAYGYANWSERTANTLDTRFGMASGCKIFTAVVICQLVEKGHLAFEMPIKDCLDVSFPHFDPAVTIHHLLTHTSGIPDYFDEEVMDDFGELWKNVPMYKIQSPGDFLPMFQNQPMKFQPGERFSYCNSGFILLGLIVEKISDMHSPNMLKNIFFRPVGWWILVIFGGIDCRSEPLLAI